MPDSEYICRCIRYRAYNMAQKQRNMMMEQNDILKEKKQLRKQMLKLRANVPEMQKKAWDAKLFETFFSLTLVASSLNFYCYMSYGTEVNTHGLVQELLSRGKRVFCPRVDQNSMDFFQIRAMNDLLPGIYGILEPKLYCKKADRSKAVMILPGLAFTKDGDRIGYGGGYYDRFLQRQPWHQTIALAYSFQVIETIPVEQNDWKTDVVVTPGHVYFCNHF